MRRERQGRYWVLLAGLALALFVLAACGSIGHNPAASSSSWGHTLMVWLGLEKPSRIVLWRD